MKEVVGIFGHYSVEQLITFCVALYGVYKLAAKGYKVLTGFHDKQQEKEILFAMIQENQNSITQLTENLDKHIKKDKEYKLGSLSDKLFVCYNSAKRQGYITARQLENFHANLQIYYDLGGNGLVKTKYEPEINGLEI